MFSTRSGLRRLVGFVGFSLLFVAGPVLAQLDEIVVTARKREETLQRIPVSVTAFRAQEIERIGIRDIQDIAQFTPGLSYQNINTTLALPVIRGLAQTNILGSENNVSNFINGIYLSNNRAFDVDLVDIERIEVIKGPQSAIYGRNSFAGAISYVTAKPSQEFESYVEGTVGDDELWEAKASISGPIIEDTLAFRVAAMTKNFDGTFDNDVGGDNLQGYENWGVYSALDWQVTESFNAGLWVYYVDQDNDHPAQVFYENDCGVSQFGTPTYICGTIPVPDDWSISRDAEGLDSENTIAGLTLEWKINENWTLSSLTGYADSESQSYLDTDGSGTGAPFSINGATGTVITNTYLGQGQTDVEDWSQELRLSFNGERWSASGGFYYYDSDRSDASLGGVDSRPLGPGDTFDSFIAAIFATPDPINAPIDSNLSEDEVETKAAFGSLSWQATDRLELSGELRYTDEEKDTNRILSFTQPGAGKDDETFDFWTWRAIVSFQATDEQLYYASAAKGVRSGGFNANATIPSENAFDEEENITYEIGAKTQWFDNRVIANLAVYYVDWSDLQIASRSNDLNNIFSVVRNTGDAESYGLELSVNAAITENLTAGAGYAYVNPEFDNGAVDIGMRTFCGTDNSLCSFNAQGDPLVGGNQLGRTNEHQFNANVEYQGPLVGEWEWYGRADLAYIDEQPVRSIETQFIDDYTIVNARVGVVSDRYEVALWSKNLFDEDYLTAVSAQPRFDFITRTDTTQAYGRTWGLTGRVKFGGAQ
jgi:iron complex outermembrane receptor protein